MKDKKGYIYILTNPSFPEYVKIGYSEDPKRRVRELNKSECTPFAFRLYATYEVDSDLSDKRLHNLIDQLNPKLRSIDDVKGKQRIREFFAMSPEEAYSLLEAMAEIHNCKDRLKKYKKSKEEKTEDNIADTIQKSRRSPFSFSNCSIRPGEKIQFLKDPTIEAMVVDDKRVEFEGEIFSLSRLAQNLLQVDHPVQGPVYFTYNNKILDSLRQD